MPTTHYRAACALACGALGLLAGCAAPKAPVFERESFGTTSTYSRSFAATGAQTCEAARRALLSQGYIVDTAKNDLVQGHKNFQPQAETHIQISFNIVCAPEGMSVKSKSTLAFATAIQDRYALKKSNSAASVGVGVLGSVSVPFSASDDSLVKVASETITASDFYARLFALVERYLAIGRGLVVEEVGEPPEQLRPVVPAAAAAPAPSPAPAAALPNPAPAPISAPAPGAPASAP
jgi:hypothetical protein